MNFSDRIRAVAGSQPFAWAYEKGIPKGTMTVWLSGATPQKKSLQRLEQLTGISAEWWKSGEGPPPAVDYQADPSRPLQVHEPPAKWEVSPSKPIGADGPDAADRRGMLLALLRTMEHHLTAPVAPEIALLMLQVVEAWRDAAGNDADLLARLEAVRAAAHLYSALADEAPRK